MLKRKGKRENANPSIDDRNKVTMTDGTATTRVLKKCWASEAWTQALEKLSSVSACAIET
jgi:hypothetical protein